MRVVRQGRAAASIALLLSLLVVSAAPAPAGPTSANTHPEDTRYRVTVSKVLAPGLTLQKIEDARGPNRISVLRMDPATALTLDVELANETIPGHETTSSMATRRGAVAAINGDYTILPGGPFAGRPVHTFIEDAELITSPLVYGRNFALSQDETRSYIEHPNFAATVTQRDSGEVFRIESWNASPVENRYTIYTEEGGSTYPPPQNACSARLLPSGPISWRTPDEVGTEQEYVVNEVRCSSRRLKRQGGIIIAAPIGTTKGDKLPFELLVGETVAVAWTVGWSGVVDTIGGNPNLLKDGFIVTDNCTGSYFCDRNPRTAIGVDAEGQILLVTVDGRQPGYSVGLKLLPLAKLMQHLGAVSALNLDGGGSTTMWAKGRVRNRVSGGFERPVGSSILVLPGSDAAEPVPFPYQTPTPLPTMSPSSSTSPDASTTPSESPGASGSPSATVTPSSSVSPSESPAATASPTESPNPAPDGGAAASFGLGSPWGTLLRSPWGAFEPATVPAVALPRPCAALHDPASTGGYLEALAAGRLGGGRRNLPLTLERAVEVFRGELTCKSFLGGTSVRRGRLND